MAKLSLALILLLVAACGGDDEATATTAPTATATPTTAAAPTETTVEPTSSSSPATTSTTPATGDETGCADVIDVSIESDGSTFTVAATVLSADTGWDKYADAWQVQTLDGTTLGERVLTHPHETEQPFTRSLSGVEIPTDVTEVVVVARDSVTGFCGAGFTVQVPHP